jgi:anti-sigma regulatory factor (Ser/Thr protein kinase)
LLYSDGLVEAHDPARQMFGFPRVRASVGAYQPGELIAGLRAELAEFTGPAWEQEDDVTLVVLERLPTADEAPEEPQPEPAARQLLRMSVPSEPGNERAAVAELITVIEGEVSLPPTLLERVQTAVAEALMNAIEHGNRFQKELTAKLEVLLAPGRLVVCVTDQGGDRPIPAVAEPDLEAKLAGLQSPRGWGLFLIQSMVDELQVESNEQHHVVKLVFNLPSTSNQQQIGASEVQR